MFIKCPLNKIDRLSFSSAVCAFDRWRVADFALSKTARFILSLRVRSALNLEISRTDITRTTGAKMGEQVRSASPLSGKRELASAPCQKHFQWDYHKNSLVPAAADPSRDTFTSMNTKDIQSPSHSLASAEYFPAKLLSSSFLCPPSQQQQVVRRRVPPSVVIVGGGVMGLGSALHLAEAGCTVTVLEREESVAKARTRDTRKQVHKQPRTYKLNFPCQS